MCTSIISNRAKTIVGWNLDLGVMDYRVRADEHGVYIEVKTEASGWLPLFGANDRGDFAGMPTCYPYDKRSEPREGDENALMLNIEPLFKVLTNFSPYKMDREVHPWMGMDRYLMAERMLADAGQQAVGQSD